MRAGGILLRRRLTRILVVVASVTVLVAFSAGAPVLRAAAPTQAELAAHVDFFSTDLNPECNKATALIIPPSVSALYHDRETIFFWPVLWGWNPDSRQWTVVHYGSWFYEQLDDTVDVTGIEYYYNGITPATHWTKWPDAAALPVETFEMDQPWFYYWNAYVWWVGPGYSYYTGLFPQHYELINDIHVPSDGCNRLTR